MLELVIRYVRENPAEVVVAVVIELLGILLGVGLIDKLLKRREAARWSRAKDALYLELLASCNMLLRRLLIDGKVVEYTSAAGLQLAPKSTYPWLVPQFRQVLSVTSGSETDSVERRFMEKAATSAVAELSDIIKRSALLEDLDPELRDLVRELHLLVSLMARNGESKWNDVWLVVLKALEVLECVKARADASKTLGLVKLAFSGLELQLGEWRAVPAERTSANAGLDSTGDVPPAT